MECQSGICGYINPCGSLDGRVNYVEATVMSTEPLEPCLSTTPPYRTCIYSKSEMYNG